MEPERIISVFICSGCGIGECLDCASLAAGIKSGAGVAACEVSDHLCSPGGLESIRKAADGGSDGIVVAACSGRTKTGLFSPSPGVEVERVNLRELVAWCQEPGDPDSGQMALDYIHVGLARIRAMKPVVPLLPEKTHEQILVVGGGVSGLTAALEAARAGYPVVLVEKERKTGGWAAKLSDPPGPSDGSFTNYRDELAQLEEASGKHPLVRLLTSTTVEQIGGQPGAFEVSVSGPAGGETFMAGAVIQATGWEPYDAERLHGLGYGSSERVITSIGLETMLTTGRLAEERPGSVVFVQCAGSRDSDHLPYCSGTCCQASLRQVTRLRELLPDTNIYVLYRDIRTPGQAELMYRDVQEDGRTFFTRAVVREVRSDREEVLVTFLDQLDGGEYSLSAGLLVLATGMVPRHTGALHLSYRQGEDLPALKYDFPDSHFICFPYETRRTGIYAAGAVRAPMDIPSCMEDATGAAMKAIQCIESVRLGRSVHPRNGDLSSPELYLPRCTDCKRCTEECPFGMYDETPKGTPLPHPARCRRCGICMGSCPERIINFSDYSIYIVSQMIKAISIPPEYEDKPRILAFACENDAYPAFDTAGHERLKYSPFIRIIPVRCIGSVNKVWISDALSQGFDGILLFGCKPGDDYQCHFIQGSELTGTRIENVQDTFRTMMLEPERLKTVVIEIDEYTMIPVIIEEFISTILALGPNPFKGM